MTYRRIAVVILFFLATSTALAQTADLTLTLEAAAAYNAGELATLKVTVKNLGPDASATAGVRLAKVSAYSVFAQQYGCIEMPDSILCNVPALAAGESHEFAVPFVAPDQPGSIAFSARTESFTLDPDHTNDSATATAKVASLPDVVTSIDVYPSLQRGKTSRTSVRVTNVASQPATGVRAFVTLPLGTEVTAMSPNCGAVGDRTLVCAIGDLTRSTSGGAYFDVGVTSDAPERTAMIVRAESAGVDWNPANNSATAEEKVYDVPDLTFSLKAPEQMGDGNRATLTAVVRNDTDVQARNLTATVISNSIVYPIVSWNAPGWDCRPVEATTIQCGTASIAAHDASTISFDVQYPLREVRSPVIVTTAQKPDADFAAPAQRFTADAVFFRDFNVTTTADSGPGTLRQAIVDANAACSNDRGAPPCRIAFAIPAPVPQEGWFTIGPLSPLPTLTITDFTIDGETQTALTGDTNGRGPEIFLDGAGAGATDGLTLNSGMATVRGLAIGGFSGNGIMSFLRPNAVTASQPRHTIERNYIGVDPTGTRAIPNGLRGIMTDGFLGTISENVISGNLRSGIWLGRADDTVVIGNRIGVAAASDAPIPNGASGVFFIDTVPFNDVRVEGNIIANNLEYGVSSSRLSRVSLFQNVLTGNRIGIDMGLDGPTADYVNGFIAPPPLITSAVYGATTGETTIEGMVPKQPPSYGYTQNATVFLYANPSAVDEGEQFLGSVVADPSGHFTTRVKSDLREKFVVGTTCMTVDFGDLFVRMSSEFGPSIRVVQ